MMKPDSNTPTNGQDASARRGLSARVAALGQSIEDSLSTSFKELAVLRRAFAIDLKAALGPDGTAARAGVAAQAVRAELEALAAQGALGATEGPIRTQFTRCGAVLAELESDLAEGDGHGAVRKVTQRSPAILSKLITILQVRDEAAQRVDHIVSGLAVERDPDAAGIAIILRSLMVGIAEVLRERAIEATDALGSLDVLVQDAFAVAVDCPGPNAAGVIAAVEQARKAFDGLMTTPEDLHADARQHIARMIAPDGVLAQLTTAMEALSPQHRDAAPSASTILLGAGPILAGLKDKMASLRGFADQFEGLAGQLDVPENVDLPKVEDALDAMWNLYTMDAERELHKAALRSVGT